MSKTSQTKATSEASKKAADSSNEQPDDNRALAHLDHPAAKEAAARGENPVTATANAMTAQREQDAKEDRGIGDNLPPDENEEMDVLIRETYKPHIKGEQNIAADLRETLAQVQSITNEIAGSQASRGSLAMADLIADLLARPEPPVHFGPGCDKALVDYIRKNELLGKQADFLVKDDSTRIARKQYDQESQQITKAPVPTNNVIDISPYRDPNLNSKLIAWSRSGWLVAIGARSSVTFGYARKADYSGKRWERHNVMLRLEDTENNGDPTVYHRVISVPLNVVHPYVWERVVDRKDNTLEMLLPSDQPEDDTKLRPLMEDWRDGLFLFYSQNMGEGKPLAACHEWFDTNFAMQKKNYVPSGYLLKAPQKKTGTKDTTKSDNRPKTYAEFQKLSPAEKEAEHKKLLEDRATAQATVIGDPKSDKFADSLNVIATMLADDKILQAMHSSAIACVLRGAFYVLRYVSTRWFGNHKPIPVDIARELGAIQGLGIFGTPRGIRSLIADEKRGDNELLIAYDNEGAEIGPLLSNGKQTLNEKAERVA